MGLSRSDWLGLGLIGGLFLLGTKKSQAATEKEASAADAKLLTRANQEKAAKWIDILTDAGGLNLPYSVAAAVARWFGIESGGNPLAVSSQGERGLAQITKTSALTEGALTQKEWDALIDKNTSSAEQARINWKIIEWCYTRASKYLTHGAPPTDPIEQIWYAKLYHQRPVDVRDAELTGEAKADAFRLEMEWAGDAKLHRLHAANVVAWNALTPPGGPVASK
jgi:hypothetical protein